MATGVGLRVGESESVAAIATSGHESEPEYVVRETVLHMTEDGETLLGGAPPEGPARTVSGFLAHVGDPAGIVVDGGAAYRAEDLVATAMFCLINLSSSLLVAPTEIHATYPADWSGEAVDALRDALDYLGLGTLTLVSEADTPATPDAEPALGAALAALTAGTAGAGVSGKEFAQFPTEEMPFAQALVAGPMVAAQAYSTVGGPSVAAAPPPPEPSPADIDPADIDTEAADAVSPASPGRRTPLLAAAGIAAALAVIGGTIAVATQNTSTTDVPQIRDAKNQPATTTLAPPAAPIVFPTETTAVPEPVVPAQPVTVYVTTELPPPPPPPLPLPPAIEPTTTPSETTTETTTTETSTETGETTTPQAATTTARVPLVNPPRVGFVPHFEYTPFPQVDPPQ